MEEKAKDATRNAPASPILMDKEGFRRLYEYTKTAEFSDDLSRIDRWDLLPALFRVKGKPFSLDGREQFSVLFGKELVRETIVMSGRQLGKCGKCTDKSDPLALRDIHGLRQNTNSPNTGMTKVASESGSRSRAGELSAYMSPGIKPILEIRTNLGHTLQVTAEHRIRTFEGYVQAGELKPGSRIMGLRKCYEFGDKEETEYRIALTAYLLGDGCCGLGHGNLEITGAGEVVDHVRRLCSEEEVSIFQCPDKPHVQHMRFRHCASICKMLVADGTYGKHSYEKSIPDWVFNLDREGTRMFIECLWATDGGVKSDRRGFACIDYCSTSPILASDLRALLSKFGIGTSMRVKKSGYRGKDGIYRRCRDAYIVRVYGYQSQKTFLETFRVPGKPSFTIHASHQGQDDRSNRDTLPEEGNCLIGKLASYLDDPRRPGKMIRGRSLHSVFGELGAEIRRKPKYPLSRFKLGKYLQAFRLLGLSDKTEYRMLEEFLEGDAIYEKVVSITESGSFQTYDLEISEFHNFVMDNIVVHNSMSLSRSEIFNLLSIPNFQMLYIAPLQEQARIYSDLYVNEAIQSCPVAQALQDSGLTGKLSDSKIIKSTGHQAFANGSGIQMTYAKFSADRLRGRYGDICDFDEVQDQNSEVIPIIQESMTSSPWGCSRYTGTAKVVENLIESKWQQSSMCEWVMKCPHCSYHNIPNMDGKVLQMIQADGVHCVHCGKKLNVREGQWIPAYPDRMRSFRGYHIPQIVCPFIVDNPNNWDKLLHKLMNGVLATFIQENLGISYSVGQRLITRAELIRQCCLPDQKTLQEEFQDRYSYTVMGVDWGGAELQSFTVATVIGIRPDGRIDVLYAKRYRGFDPDEQLVDMARICRFYKCSCLTGETLVLTRTPLTNPCYKRIIDVTTKDWVWDGHEWVRHDGIRLMRLVDRRDLHGVGNTRTTGDHKVYISETESRRADALSGEGRASALAWGASSSPISPWHDVWISAPALFGACSRFFRSLFRKECRKEKG